MDVKGCECIKNAQVYGLEESIRRAKFPMSTDTDSLTTELTRESNLVLSPAPVKDTTSF